MRMLPVAVQFRSSGLFSHALIKAPRTLAPWESLLI